MLDAYGGMAVGEHLGFVTQGTWALLLSLSLLHGEVFDRRLAWAGVAIAAVTYLVAIEPLSTALSFLAPLGIGLSGAFLIWLFVLGVSLSQTDPVAGRGPRVGWKTGLACAVVRAVAAAPGLF